MSLWQLSQSLHAQPFWQKMADHLQLWWLLIVVSEQQGVLAKRCWGQLGWVRLLQEAEELTDGTWVGYLYGLTASWPTPWMRLQNR